MNHEIRFEVTKQAIMVRVVARCTCGLAFTESAVTEQVARERLKAKGWAFYSFIGGGARFMCSWATQLEAIEHLAHDIGESIGA